MSPRRELLTTTQVADLLGHLPTNPTGRQRSHARAMARQWLARHRVAAVQRQPGSAGENLYPARAVREAMDKRTGQGFRSDLKPKENPR